MTKPLFAVVILLVAFSCGPQRKVTRVTNDTVIDLSGRWSDTDSQQTSQAMITQSLTEARIGNFVQQNSGKKPVVIVGFATNNTDEHIPSETFIKDLEKAFINSGQVRLVTGGAKRDKIRKERAQQQDFGSVETMKHWGQEVGAGYILERDIISIIDSFKKEKVIYHQVNLQLTDIETTEIVCLGDQEIYQRINRGGRKQWPIF